jgi:hypothetical protein
MKTILLLPSLLILLITIGCGNHTKIEYHIVSQEELNIIAGEPAWGYATWDDKGYVVYCDIYLLPEYPTEQCYKVVLRHEQRHCYEFNFHSEKYLIPECE